MLDVLNLERRWLRYKIKTYLPYVTAFGISILLIIGISIWFSSDSSQPKKLKEHAPVQNISSAQTFPLAIPQSIPETVPAIDTTLSQQYPVQEPVTSTVLPIKQNNSTATAHISLPKKTVHVVQQTPIPSPKILASTETTVQPVPTISSTPNKDEKSLVINRNESKLDVDSLQQRFKETSNPNLGLFIARYHYDHGNFSEAYNYALKTNAVNSRIDESWIIFSKSLVKLGKTEQAKKTLEFYIPQSNSENAKILLDSIEKGDFK